MHPVGIDMLGCIWLPSSSFDISPLDNLFGVDWKYGTWMIRQEMNYQYIFDAARPANNAAYFHKVTYFLVKQTGIQADSRHLEQLL